MALLLIWSQITSAEQSVRGTFGDWALICENETVETRQCQIVQSVQRRKAKLMFQTAIGFVDGHDLPTMFLTSPLGILIPPGITVDFGSKDPDLAAPIQKCDEGGCLAVVSLEADQIKRLSKAPSAEIIFFASAGRSFKVPLNLKSFAEAYDALTKEHINRASNKP